ncbi:MAG: acetylglutamate kinase [Clostridiales bacterium]|nr:acetylglutamate kinase [Clostridiales bacterium]
MTVSNADRAAILVHALPYIKKYTGKIVVIKYGGSAMQSETLKNSVVRDVILLHLIGVKVVLVHGGGPEITELLTRLGKETKFVGGLRVTDRETVEAAQMVLAGKVNKSLVNLIECCGGRAVGLCGMDGHMISAVQKDPALGYVGRITAVDPTPVLDLLEKGYIPVVSTLGCDDAGNVYNVNADTAAAKLAATLRAESLISLTDTAGILRDKDDPATLISRVTVAETEQLIAAGVIAGGMLPKVECCTDAIRGGVRRVFIIDGRAPHSILIETLTDEGIGTMFEGEGEQV